MKSCWKCRNMDICKEYDRIIGRLTSTAYRTCEQIATYLQVSDPQTYPDVRETTRQLYREFIDSEIIKMFQEKLAMCCHFYVED